MRRSDQYSVFSDQYSVISPTSPTSPTFLWLLPLLLVLVGCSSERQYRELRRAYNDGAETDYYRQTLAAATVDAAVPVQDKTLDDVIRRLVALRDEWSKKAGSGAASATIFDPQSPTIRGLLPVARGKKLADALSKQLSLDLVLATAYERNPGLKSARSKLRAAAERYPQAASLDDILKQYNAFTRELDTMVGPKQHKQMRSMAFPFPDATALKGKIVNEEVAAAQQGYETALRDLVAQTRDAYFDYAFILDAIRITKENQGLLKPVLKVARSHYRVGSARYGEVIMLQVELSKLTNDIITLEQQRDTIRARLNALLDRPVGAPLGAPAAPVEEKLAPTVEQLYAAAVKGRQEVRKLEYNIERMRLMVELASKMTYPDASLGASYLEDRVSRDAKFMARRTLPESSTAFFGQKDAYIREMRLQVASMEKKLEDLRNATRFLVKKAHFSMDAADRSLKLHRSTFLPQARQAFQAAQTGYQSGKTGFITYLDAERTLLKFELGEKRALRDYQKAVTELDRLIGGRVKRGNSPAK